MLTYAIALVFGALVGCLAAIPGVHPSVLMVGLMPLLGVRGDAGAVAVTAAVGSALACSALAKTFHPANAQTLESATPEQVMAYRGEGPKAIKIQSYATWLGVITVLIIGVPLLLAKGMVGDGYREILDAVFKPIAPIVIIAFFAVTWWQAKNKVQTILIMVLGSALGFYAMNHPYFAGNPMVLSPLLGGAFSVAPLAMVLGGVGSVAFFPKQTTKNILVKAHKSTLGGAFGGMLTALVAGLGSGAAVSSFAGNINHEEYLGMSTAAEAANNTFAILLFLIAGMSRSGSAVALKQDGLSPDLTMGLLLLLAVFFGLMAGTQLAERCVNIYIKIVSAVPQRLLAAVVLVGTLTLVIVETGPAGLLVAFAAASLGLVAKLNCIPNQALVTVLTGPVLIYYLGQSANLSQILGVMH